MQVKWTGDDREVPVENEDGVVEQVNVSRGDLVDLPIDMARSFIAQGLAEHKPPKRAAPKKAEPVADEPPVNEEGDA